MTVVVINMTIKIRLKIIITEKNNNKNNDDNSVIIKNHHKHETCWQQHKHKHVINMLATTVTIKK